MKNVVTLKHLFRLSGKDGSALGTEAPSIYFDGKHAVAACAHATVSIDCPQQIETPVLVEIKDLKVALIAGEDLQFRQDGEGLRINGISFPAVPAADVIPQATAEMLDLDKTIWHLLVKPFRLDGGRLSQIVRAMASNDVRTWLNGLYLDFATGAIVGVDGHRIHLVEDAIPVAALPAHRMQGVILPAELSKLLATVGGVQEVFVMERESGKETGEEGAAFNRAICVGAANAKFRIREVAAENYINYRAVFDQNRALPVAILLDARSVKECLAMADIAATNPNFPVVTIAGQGRQISISHQGRVERQLPMSYQVGTPFEVHVGGNYLGDAIRAAGNFGSTVRMRFGRSEERGIYVGAQDFHAIVAVSKLDAEGGDEETASTGEIQSDELASN